MRLPSVFVVLGFASLLPNCVGNPYNEFYQPAAASAELAQRRIAPAPELPELSHGNDPKTDVLALVGDGYVVIGSYNFTGTRASDEEALKQGKQVGADRVLVYDKYANTVQTVTPITVPVSKTFITNSNATVFGTGGAATVSGSSVTTAYGSETTFVPMSFDRYDFLAVYFVRVKSAFGAQSRNLNAQESQQAGTVNGAVLLAVVRASPAAAAGFLPGDIVTKIDGHTIIDALQFNDSLKKLHGRRVTMSVIRRGKRIELPVTCLDVG